MRAASGFTLIELMFVTIIVAILAGAAMAGYGQYILRANRVDAITTLLRIGREQERFYLQNNRYATTTTELTQPQPGGLGIPGTERGLYDIGLAAGDGGATGGFSAVAVARIDGRQWQDSDCRTYGIDQSGRRLAITATGSTGPEVTERCWR